ncbi:MAG: lamin tail domain-containing protein [Bacteroidia bacterium]|nr:lamin tail domain-containing protein [Bacteroidia bacterium]
MEKNLLKISLSGLLLTTLMQLANSQILISGYNANPSGTDSPYEYVQLRATQAINFALNNYSVVFNNNGTATSTGWITGGGVTYGFNLTSGAVAAGDVFYVGGSGKLINGAGSTDIQSANWIRTISTETMSGDGFGNAGTSGVLGNGGSSADGIAVFAGNISSLTATSIPLDVVFFGTAVGNAKPATGGYMLPDNDHYISSQGTFGNGTNTFFFGDPVSSVFSRLTGSYNLNTGTWDVARTVSTVALSSSSQLSDIASTLTLISVDVTPPTVASVVLINSTNIRVVFSEAVSSSTAQNTANYTGVGTVSVVTLTGADTVTLALNAAVTAGQSYTLTISNISDLADNMMSAPYNYPFIYNNTIGQLVINEIMYDDPGSGADSLEFIELYNAGAASITLGGYHFTGAVTYEFPPLAMAAGTYIVLAKYSSVVNSFFSITSTGWTLGNLDNNGAAITILNTTGDVVDAVTYSNVSPWPTGPNGNGPSLILCDPASDNSLASNWSYSIAPAGTYQSVPVFASPGAANVCIPLNTPPSISGFSISPASPNELTVVNVSATITDNGSVTSAILHWGTDGFTFSNSINMNLSTGSTWVTSSPITAQPAATTVFYYIVATDNETLITTSATQNYLVASSGPVTQTETFTNLAAFSSYTNGSFTGDNGYTWYYVQSRDDAGYQINGRGLLLRNLASLSDCHSQTLTGGISSISVDLKKGFTSAGYRQAEVFINGVSVGTSVAFDDLSVHTMTVTNLSIVGNIVIKIANKTAYQIVIDNITWTGYTAVNFPPVVSNIAILPSAPISADNVSVSATVTDDGTVSYVSLSWGTDGISFPNTITMNLSSGSTYCTSSAIPAQATGTTVYYRITATDDLGLYTTSPVASYFIPPVITIYQIQGQANVSPYAGQVVQTSGTVTARSPAGFFLQDGSGAWNGVYVSMPVNTVSMGDLITLRATVSEDLGMTELQSITYLIVNSSGNILPAPVVITIPQMCEDYEGVLVKVENVTCTNPSLGADEWLISDGTCTAGVNNMFYTYAPLTGSQYNVTGPLNYTGTAFKIEPRDSADIADVTVVPETQVISLVQGWGIFSTYIEPANPAIDMVMASVIPDILIAKSGTGQVFWPVYGINNIGNMITGNGYQVKTQSAVALCINGIAVIPQNTPISLSQGWNLIAYLRNTNGNIETMMSSIVSEIVLVKSGSGLVYWPYYNLNGIGNMIPGQGYYVYLLSASTLTYPADAFNNDKSFPLDQENRHFGKPVITGNNMTLGLMPGALAGFPESSEIAVFDENGLLVGNTVLSSGFNAVTIWGDDDLSAEKDGLYNLETFCLRLWNPVENTEIPVFADQWISGNNQFTANGISIAASLKLSGTEFPCMYPNPASKSSTIQFYTNSDSHIDISICTLAGSIVSKPVSGIFSAGNHRVDIDLSEFANGSYLVRLTTAGSVQTLQLNIIR